MRIGWSSARGDAENARQYGRSSRDWISTPIDRAIKRIDMLRDLLDQALQILRLEHEH